MAKLRRFVPLLVVGLAITMWSPVSAGALPAARAPGYVLAASDGGVFVFGRHFHGSAANLHLRAPIVGVASTPDGGGYWLVASDGGVFSFGNARFFGSMGGVVLNQPIVGIAATPDGGGYWLVASDGGVFSFGNAHFFGSEAGAHILAPVAAIATTASGHGYWLMTTSGEAFAFGDALASGAPPALQAPVGPDYVAIDRVPGTARGIVLLNEAGTRVAFDAAAAGCSSMVFFPTPRPLGLDGIAMSGSGCGELLAASDGGVFAFGAPFLGSAVPFHPAAPIVGIAT